METRPLPNIVVMNWDTAESYEWHKPHIVISIASVGCGPCNLPDRPNRLATLRLNFHDFDRPVSALSMNGYFSSEQARQIWEFVEAHKEVDIIVHCEAGISRSPAVAAALSWRFNGRLSDAPYFKRYIPNRYVYSMMLNTLFEMDKERIAVKP